MRPHFLFTNAAQKTSNEYLSILVGHISNHLNSIVFLSGIIELISILYEVALRGFEILNLGIAYKP